MNLLFPLKQERLPNFVYEAWDSGRMDTSETSHAGIVRIGF